jgi:hypothetical protein
MQGNLLTIVGILCGIYGLVTTNGFRFRGVRQRDAWIIINSVLLGGNLVFLFLGLVEGK